MDKRAEKAARAARLMQARMDAGFPSPRAAARKFGWKEETYKAHENGRNGFDNDAGRAYAAGFDVNVAWLMTGEGSPKGDLITEPDDGQQIAPEVQPEAAPPLPEPNASYPLPVSFPHRKLPVYGQAAGGMDEEGKFILNGQKIADVICPAALENVVGAYAVYHTGDSMIPRYEPGELLTIHPGLPVRKGDYVLVQIAGDDGDPPYGYVKKFVSKNAKELVLEQLNPPDGHSHILRFPADRVLTVHRIFSSGIG